MLRRNPRLLGKGQGGRAVVAGEHIDANARLRQFPNGFGTVRLNDVRKGDHAGKRTVHRGQNRRFPFACIRLQRLRRRRDVHAVVAQETRLADQYRFAAHYGPDPVAGYRSEGFSFCLFCPGPRSVFHDRRAERMLRFLFRGGRQGNQRSGLPSVMVPVLSNTILSSL